MESLPALLQMGGYAGFVWPAYGVALVVMVGVLMASVRAARANETELERLQRARPGRARRRPAGTEIVKE